MSLDDADGAEPGSTDRLDMASVLHHTDFQVAVIAALEWRPQLPRPASISEENEGDP